MGYLAELWNLYDDPDGPTPYTPYKFVPFGHFGIPNMNILRDFARRSTITVVPGVDSVLDSNGFNAGPTDQRPFTISFRVFTEGDNDAAWDLLTAQIAPGEPQRLVWMTDQGVERFTIGFNPSIKQTETAANNWGYAGFVDFTVTWRIRPYWTLRYPELATPTKFSPAAGERFLPGGTERFAAAGSTIIASASQLVLLDATGIAGNNLPTIPNRKPIFFLVGGCGGDAGIQFINIDSFAVDKTGSRQPRQFTLSFKLLNPSDSCLLDFSKMKFWHNGVPFRPWKPDYQAEYMQIEPNKINHLYINGLGANILTGGAVTPSWFRLMA